MARPKKESSTAKSKRKPGECCGMCIHSGRRFEIGHDGKPFLCWCPFHEFARFLKRDWCDHFKEGDPIQDEPTPFERHKTCLNR